MTKPTNKPFNALEDPKSDIEEIRSNLRSLVQSHLRLVKIYRKTPHGFMVTVVLLLTLAVICFQLGRNYGVTESDAKLIPIIERCLDIRLVNRR